MLQMFCISEHYTCLHISDEWCNNPLTLSIHFGSPCHISSSVLFQFSSSNLKTDVIFWRRGNYTDWNDYDHMIMVFIWSIYLSWETFSFFFVFVELSGVLRTTTVLFVHLSLQDVKLSAEVEPFIPQKKILEGPLVSMSLSGDVGGGGGSGGLGGGGGGVETTPIPSYLITCYPFVQENQANRYRFCLPSSVDSDDNKRTL